MAELSDFQESNHVWRAPKGAVNVQDLPCLRAFSAEFGAMENISAWKLSEKERKAIAETGIVWLSVLGNNFPPVLILGTEPEQVTRRRESKD